MKVVEDRMSGIKFEEYKELKQQRTIYNFETALDFIAMMKKTAESINHVTLPSMINENLLAPPV